MSNLKKLQALREMHSGSAYWIFCAAIDVLIEKDPTSSLEYALDAIRVEQSSQRELDDA